ncbi:hypothetical protein BDK51DRAFT_38289 [Blyttiomyces helicus]|uniref:Uncharacterized protein n=1 Tax=Blyttiomyces helicus TaxID=388810 RepID=A0A4V1IQF9_9FUNG|nr:hypothetical protein BDK51DRAFT_38289 [Blyttiomyces helicus]|eukprot:RKO86417.1 hypothetical protein BDK51DRAFT_38289 [Blyttiomyces helicus]
MFADDRFQLARGGGHRRPYIFAGCLRSRITCLQCASTFDTAGEFSELNPAINEVHSIEESLALFTRGDILDAHNLYLCVVTEMLGGGAVGTGGWGRDEFACGVFNGADPELLSLVVLITSAARSLARSASPRHPYMSSESEPPALPASDPVLITGSVPDSVPAAVPASEPVSVPASDPAPDPATFPPGTRPGPGIGLRPGSRLGSHMYQVADVGAKCGCAAL